MIFSKKQLLIALTLSFSTIVFLYFYVDMPVRNFFVEHRGTYRYFGGLLSIPGESHWYFIIAILGALFFTFIKKNKLYTNRFLFLLYANIFSGLLSTLIKAFFGRLRPLHIQKDPDGYGSLFLNDILLNFKESIQIHYTSIANHFADYASFPSGHTTTTFTVFTYLSILFPKYIYLWLVLAISVASGRILHLSHFPSDVVAGATLGIFSTLFVYSKMKNKLNLNY